MIKKYQVCPSPRSHRISIFTKIFFLFYGLGVKTSYTDSYYRTYKLRRNLYILCYNYSQVHVLSYNLLKINMKQIEVEKHILKNTVLRPGKIINYLFEHSKKKYSYIFIDLFNEQVHAIKPLDIIKKISSYFQSIKNLSSQRNMCVILHVPLSIEVQQPLYNRPTATYYHAPLRYRAIPLRRSQINKHPPKQII